MDNFQDAQPMSTENEDQEELPSKTRRQRDWMRKCISNFSLYSHILLDRAADHTDVGGGGEFKKKLSKSTKKRLRRQKKKRLATGTQLIRKQTRKDLKRKDLKKIIKGIAQI